MKKIYLKILELAKPYYEKGRPMDMGHIEWIMKEVLFFCKKENIDDFLLLPLVILHDIGYAEVPKDNPFNLNLRKAHMKEGKKIAKEILEKLNYSKNKTEKIVDYVSIHDNWAFGDTGIYRKY
jgi:HD superfamily phosphodiesterase